MGQALLWIGVMGTLAVVIASGLAHLRVERDARRRTRTALFRAPSG